MQNRIEKRRCGLHSHWPGTWMWLLLLTVSDDGSLALRLNLTASCAGAEVYFCMLKNISATFVDPLVVVANASAPELVELVVRDSVIGRLPNAIFEQAPNLHSLLLHNCGINRLQVRDFRDAIKLRGLTLQQNRLSDIPMKAFVLAPALSELLLGDNTIHTVHKTAFYGLDRLQYLDLQRNAIRELPDGVFDPLANLKHVDLSGNSIERIDRRTFASNAQLETVLLSDNQFAVFEANALEHIPRLQLLDLSNSALDELVVQSVDTLLVQNSGLKRCLIKGGAIKVHAGNNQLPGITINERLAVRELELHLNQIESLDDMVGMLNLQRLDVAKNRIGSVRTSQSPQYLPLPSLTSLNLAFNRLHNLSGEHLMLLQKLTHLDLAFNHMVRLDADVLRPLRSLEKFYMEGNRLVSFDYQHFQEDHEHLHEIGLFENDWKITFLRQMVGDLQQHGVRVALRFPAGRGNNDIELVTKVGHHHRLTGNFTESYLENEHHIRADDIHPYWTTRDILAFVTLLLAAFIFLLEFYRIFKQKQCFDWCCTRVVGKRAAIAVPNRRARLEEDDSEV